MKPPATTPIPARAESLPVLLVDDEKPIRDMFAGALESAGYRTLQAADGREALDLLARQPVAMILLDCQMPRMNGLECLTALRDQEATRSLPVIMVTGLSEVEDRVRGLATGATDYLTKPVSLPELLARVRAHLRDRAYWTEVMDRDLRDRRAICATLSRIPSETGPAEVAQQMIDRFAGIVGIPSVALHHAMENGAIRTLASRGALARIHPAGTLLPDKVVSHLRDRFQGGPWVESGPAPGEPGDDAAPADLGIRASAFAPIEHAGVVLALLQVAVTSARLQFPREELVHRMPALIDFAGFAGGLLGPGLARHEHVEKAREAMRRIIEGKQFTPVFQPIARIDEFRVVGYEALTRFKDGVRPDLRFAEAASLGLRSELEMACLRAADSASEVFPANLYLSINVSPRLILEQGPLRDLLRNCPRELALEVTEHEPVENYAELRKAIEGLGREVTLAVDDAGAGFSSMRHILELRPQLVKLDCGLVRDIPSNTAQQALIAGMAYFGNRTESLMVAEGIETEAELACLRSLGITLGQGYLLGRPKPAGDWTK